MSILEKLNYNKLNIIFSYIGEKSKLLLLKINKSLMKKCKISLYDYQNYYFSKNIIVDKETLLDYYQYLKRCYSKNFDLETIKNYYITFFCNYLNTNNIDFILDASHELVVDILLSDILEKIKIIIYVEDFKPECKNICKCYKKKKPFLALFKALFNNHKVSQIIILKKEKNYKIEEEFEYIKQEEY